MLDHYFIRSPNWRYYSCFEASVLDNHTAYLYWEELLYLVLWKKTKFLASLSVLYSQTCAYLEQEIFFSSKRSVYVHPSVKGTYNNLTLDETSHFSVLWGVTQREASSSTHKIYRTGFLRISFMSHHHTLS